MSSYRNQLKNINYLESTDEEEEEENTYTGSLEEACQGEPQIEKSARNRRASANLLDMTEYPCVQPNVISQRKPCDSLHESNKNSVNLLDKNDCSTSLTLSLHEFDPLQKPQKQPLSVDGAAVVDTKSPTKAMPTRLPTPRKSANYTQSTESVSPTTNSSNNPTNPTLIATNTTTFSLVTVGLSSSAATSATPSKQLGPTPPSSPGRRVRHTSIARLVKPIPRESGKANRDLAEFDPLISPVRNNKTIPDIDDSKEDLLTLSPTILLPSKKGAHHATLTEHSNTIGDLMKHQQEKTSIKPCSSNTRIPLPKSVQQQQNTSSKIAKDETQQIQEPANITRSTAINQVPNIPTATTTTPATKLRKPEVVVPKSIKQFPPNSRKEVSVNYQRRPSFPTGATDILQDQLDRERENSRRLSANLISAQGLISQPDDLVIEDHPREGFPPLGIYHTASHDSRMDKIHDRLQCLVDVCIPTESEEQQHNDEPAVEEYRKEDGNLEVMSAK
ncbi:hypothetical protein BD408DRAFT_390276, partial [Parasitella parasitica]